MKNKFLIVIGFMLFASGAMSQTEVRTTKGTVISEDYVFMKIENQVEISYSTFTKDGKTFLNIHFRNLSAESKEFDWQLTTPDGQIIKGDESIKLNSDSLSNLNQIVIMDSINEMKSYQVVLTFK